MLNLIDTIVNLLFDKNLILALNFKNSLGYASVECVFSGMGNLKSRLSD